MPATALILAGAETAFPALLGRAVDSLTGHAVGRSWVWWCVALVGVLIATDVVDDLASGTMTATSTAWLRQTLVRHLLKLSPRTTGLATGDAVTRVVGNSADIGRIGSEIVRGAVNIVPVVGGTIALGLINIWLLVTFLLSLPIALLIVRSFARDASAAAASYLHEQGRIAGSLAEALAGSRTIAAAGTQEREFERILAPLPKLHGAGIAMWKAQTRALSKDSLLVPLLEVAVLGVAGVLLAHGQISAGEMLAASQYVILAAGFSAAIGIIQQLARSRAAAARAAQVLSQPVMTYGKRRLPRGNGQVAFRGVTVRSAGGVLLEQVDLDIPAGALVAVVGPSGSGKSVLAAVVGRLADPDEGEVLLDGVPVQNLSHDALRRAVTYGFERPNLVGNTIADVIAFGSRRPSSRDLLSASRAARADTFIEHMPGGYRTPLAEAPMSGGEIQRVGLARAFAHLGRVVVLDDVASRLDTVTEQQIAGVLTSPTFTQTRVVVAHRASTAARADLVVWLERGRLRATGLHQELWAHSGYRRLFEPVRSARPVSLTGHTNGKHS